MRLIDLCCALAPLFLYCLLFRVSLWFVWLFVFVVCICIVRRVVCCVGCGLFYLLFVIVSFVIYMLCVTACVYVCCAYLSFVLTNCRLLCAFVCYVYGLRCSCCVGCFVIVCSCVLSPLPCLFQFRYYILLLMLLSLCIAYTCNMRHVCCVLCVIVCCSCGVYVLVFVRALYLYCIAIDVYVPCLYG